jgi:pyrroline-5-carboxylate reductase
MSTQLEGTVSFLGSGLIAEAWLLRLISAGLLPPDRIMVCDPRGERTNELAVKLGVRVGPTNVAGAGFARMVVLAPPPTETAGVLREIAPALTEDKIVISLAAGMPITRLQELARPSKAVRIMPNTPGQVGEAMNLIVFGAGCPAETRTEVGTLLSVLGRWFEVDDDQMDYWCALCAVGPTYVFPIIEALAAAASAKGLPPGQALEAAAQVVAGAARMVQLSGKSIAELNGMISIRTLPEQEAKALFAGAYQQAVEKLQGLSRRLAASA